MERSVNNQKLENLLNLALDADENERERSEILDVGYDPIEKEWELIVKYSGDIDMIRPLVVDMHSAFELVYDCDSARVCD